MPLWRPVAALASLLLAVPAVAVDRIDPRDWQTAIDPCVDLYGFANGGWLKATPVPAGSERLNRFIELERLLQQQLRQLVRDLVAAAGADGSAADPLGVFLRSAVDETALPAARAAALAALLPAVEQARHTEQLVQLLHQLQQRGLAVVVEIQDGDPVRLQASFPTLGDPAFYLDPAEAARDLLGRYRGYIETLLVAAGSVDPATDSAWVIDLETQLAQAQSSATETPPWRGSPRELRRQQRTLDWKPLLELLGVAGQKQLQLDDPAAFAALDRLLSQAPPAAWRAWLRFRILHLLAPYLDAPFSGPRERFFASALGSQPSPSDRIDFALALAQRWLGSELTARYLQHHPRAVPQAQVEQMFSQLRQQLAQAIDARSEWQPATRKRAQEKLAALKLEWAVPSAAAAIDFKPAPGNLVGNVLSLARARSARRAANAAATWPLPAQLQLHYHQHQQRLLLSPLLLQPPLWPEDAEPALRWAGLGSLLAGELLRGFDLAGSQINARGRTDPWWEESDRAAWHAAAEPLRRQLDGLQAWGGRRFDSQRLVAGSLADLGALQLAWSSWRSEAGTTEGPLLDGRSPAQRFFLAWASLWRENAHEAAELAALDQASHLPPAWRANAPMAHLPAFAEAFACPPERSPLLPADQRAVAWP